MLADGVHGRNQHEHGEETAGGDDGGIMQADDIADAQGGGTVQQVEVEVALLEHLADVGVPEADGLGHGPEDAHQAVVDPPDGGGDGQGLGLVPGLLARD